MTDDDSVVRAAITELDAALDPERDNPWEHVNAARELLGDAETPREHDGDLTLDDLPDPAEEAAEIADIASERGLGVARDELTDLAIEAESARVELEKLYVTLDALCDNRGAFPAAIQSYLRFVQHRSTLYQEWFAEYEAALRTERDAVLREIHDDSTPGGETDE